MYYIINMGKRKGHTKEVHNKKPKDNSFTIEVNPFGRLMFNKTTKVHIPKSSYSRKAKHRKSYDAGN